MELNDILHAIGWTLINSVWQGFFILMILMLAMLFINTRYSKVRSMIAFASLLILFATSIRTFLDVSYKDSSKSKIVSEVNSFENYSLALLHEPIISKEKIDNNEATLFNQFFKDTLSFSNNNIDYIVIVWLLGVILMSLRLFGGFLYVQKLKTLHTLRVDKNWQKLFDELLIKFQVSKPVKLLESTIAKAPMVIGYFKPVILMPLGTLTSMPVNQVEMILAHEIAHIKNSDYLLNLLQSFLEIIYFFNPAVWIISKIIRTEREFVCDDLALSINKNSTLLAKALIAIQLNESNNPTVALSALGNKNSLLGRIKRMKNQKNMKSYEKHGFSQVCASGRCRFFQFVSTHQAR